MGAHSEDWIQGYWDGYHFREFFPGEWDAEEYAEGYNAAIAALNLHPDEVAA